MTRQHGERFKLVIEDTGGMELEGSADARLKRLVKLMLRGFKFRLVEIHPAGEDGTIRLTEDSDE